EIWVFSADPPAWRHVFRTLDRGVARDRQHDASDQGAGAVEFEIHHLVNLTVGLDDPVVTGDPQIEITMLHRLGDLLRTEDFDLSNPRIRDRRGVLAIATASNRQVCLLEELQRHRFETALGQYEVNHDRAPGRNTRRCQYGKPGRPGPPRSRSCRCRSRSRFVSLAERDPTSRPWSKAPCARDSRTSPTPADG